MKHSSLFDTVFLSMKKQNPEQYDLKHIKNVWTSFHKLEKNKDSLKENAMHSRIDHQRNMKSVGGHSRITHLYNMIEMKDGSKFIFCPKKINLSYLLLNSAMFSFTNNFKTIYRVSVYGAGCIDTHEYHTFCIVQDKHTGEMLGFPLFTETALGASKYIRKHKQDFKMVHYATLIETAHFPTNRWIRIARTGNGMTGIMELTGDPKREESWNPVSYMFDRYAEILKLELFSLQEDFIHENEKHEVPYQEWSVGSSSYQMILNRCIFLKENAY